MSLAPDRVQTWSADPRAAAVTSTRDGYRAAANGTRFLAGGWQFHYDHLPAAARLRVAVPVTHSAVPVPRDQLRCIAAWGDLEPGAGTERTVLWDHLLPCRNSPTTTVFAREVAVPPGATSLTVRTVFRWSSTGETCWGTPQIEPLPALPAAPPVAVAVVTGQMRDRGGAWTLDRNVDFYATRAAAAAAAGAKLVVLPEIALQWQVPGTVYDLAVTVPGPETAPFQELARRYQTRICLGLNERDGEAVYNSAVLIGPSGEVDGCYHKVHLAEAGESDSGVLPGDDFPVYQTEVGRIGCNICMDSSAAESSRMVGLQGADFLLLPIMGDHRADRFSLGPPIHHDSRWLAIQRTHAMDNQLCLVAARNTVQASCIIDRKGEVLAWNDGDQDAITADVTLDDGYRVWQGGCFRDINWMQRRPSVYGAFTADDCLGSLR
ncbi:MAG: carbon-nitrogen hydrolase family protein [Fimbriimonadaceae bacterium]|nr:carbon-nitrogen hydrolase family protein [Fimbriimonadaceae bacterium]